MEKIKGALELQTGELKSFSVDGERIGVFRKDKDTFYTFQDVCTHDGAPICDGKVENDEVVCPRHGARFSLQDGSVKKMPASAPLDIYPNKIVEGELHVQLDD